MTLIDIYIAFSVITFFYPVILAINVNMNLNRSWFDIGFFTFSTIKLLIISIIPVVNIVTLLGCIMYDSELRDMLVEHCNKVDGKPLTKIEN
jgi:hypothetical protein